MTLKALGRLVKRLGDEYGDEKQVWVRVGNGVVGRVVRPTGGFVLGGRKRELPESGLRRSVSDCER